MCIGVAAEGVCQTRQAKSLPWAVGSPRSCLLCWHALRMRHPRPEAATSKWSCKLSPQTTPTFSWLLLCRLWAPFLGLPPKVSAREHHKQGPWSCLQHTWSCFVDFVARKAAFSECIWSERAADLPRLQRVCSSNSHRQGFKSRFQLVLLAVRMATDRHSFFMSIKFST